MKLVREAKNASHAWMSSAIKLAPGLAINAAFSR
jgi:hypothetical protein